MKSPKRLLVVQLLALAGAVISLIQTKHFYAVRDGLAGFKSFCQFEALGGAFDCNAIDMSRYAELVAGIPLSAFAAGWFIAAFVIAWITHSPFWRRDGLRALFALYGLGSVFSLAYLYVMFAVLKTGCILCLSIDAINWISFAIILSLKPESMKQHAPLWAQWKVFLGTLVAATLACVILGLSFKQVSVPAREVDALIEQILTKPAMPVDTQSPDLSAVGPANAPITIVKFSDFQCPHCRNGAMAVNPLFSRYKDRLRFVFKNFPLDSACNRKVPQPMHPAACEAAKVVICATKAGHFHDVYAAIFEKQEELASGKPTEIAVSLGLSGLDEASLRACVESDATRERLSRDVEEGLRLDIQSTPTFFVNGRKIEGSLPTSVWIKLLDRMHANSPGNH